ncbi:MAG TPA: hypothetical protein VMH92_01275 [Acidocella sp.]|nr:hypothetical protein [Acidocella sp.]
MLIKNLRRVAEQMLAYRTARQAADELADRLHGVGGRRLTPAQCSGSRCLLGLVDTVLAAGSAFRTWISHTQPPPQRHRADGARH